MIKKTIYYETCNIGSASQFRDMVTAPVSIKTRVITRLIYLASCLWPPVDPFNLFQVDGNECNMGASF